MFRKKYLERCFFVQTKISVSLGGLPCLADGNKVRQVFTNLLSSSPFSPLQDYLVCSSPMNVSHMSPMLQKSPLCLIWLQRVEKARHATLFSFQPSPARLIKPGFHKKLGVLAPEQLLMCIWKKSRGEDFIGVKSLIFESVCQSNWTTAGSKTPAVFVPCSVYPFWL